MEQLFKIWSIEHQAWWAPNRRGYDKQRRNGGIYSLEEALKIVRDANINLGDVPNEAMVQCVTVEDGGII